jgi:serine/threonine protein phosphatase 1
MPPRTIAVGDIHGCSAAIDALLNAIRPRPEDVIVTLGDYIDRGPDSKGALERLIELARRCRLVPLLGNHEEMLFEAMADSFPLEFFLGVGGDAILDSYGPVVTWVCAGLRVRQQHSGGQRIGDDRGGRRSSLRPEFRIGF